MMKKQLLIASLALTVVVGGGLVGITHAASDSTETNSGQAQTVIEVTYDGQQGNVDDGQQGNTDDGQQGNTDDGQQNG